MIIDEIPTGRGLLISVQPLRGQENSWQEELDLRQALAATCLILVANNLGGQGIRVN
ncbi:hypothetical protein LguiB_005864 [Lonicera macranthoides]